MKHYTVYFEPDHSAVKVHRGASLLEAAGLAGIILSNPCGGVGRCGKCKVQVLPSKKEVRACQHMIEHDTSVWIPESSRFYKQQILEHGIQRRLEGQTCIRKIFVKNPTTQVHSFCETLSNHLSSQVIIANSSENELSSQLAASPGHGITAIVGFYLDEADPELFNSKLIGLEMGDTTETLFGLAVDIGTTSVVARLVDLATSRVVTTVSAENPQAHYGADVLSRISYCQSQDQSERLHTAIVRCINELAQKASGQCGIECQDIYEIVAAGNTTMNHLLLKYPVAQLGQAPYQAHCIDPADLQAAELGFTINPSGTIHSIGNIAGFVGSDTVAAALACGLDITEMNTLLVDIGTNGEIVYGTRSNLIAASCAAGPALEGAGIEFGSRAQSGAIERVLFDEGDIDVDVIGSIPPHSLCGSGLIDAIAVMLDLGIIDATGRFCEEDELPPSTPKAVCKRRVLHDTKPAFVLAGDPVGDAWEHAILLTQKDVRQLQLAKAAIRAGIELLLKNAGMEVEDIQQILLAGAFGNYINKENAVRIGLLPKVHLEKIHFVGNAAGSGAEMVLTSQKARKLASDLSRQINYIEIAHQTEFQVLFSEFMMFPEN